MLKTEITNNILNEMFPILSEDQLRSLKNTVIRCLYGYEINSESTEIVVHENDNIQYLQKWKNYMKIENKAEGTIYRYTSCAYKFLESIKKNFRDVNGDDAAYYLAVLKSKGTLAETTLDNTRKYIKSFFNWLYEQEIIDRNPFSKIKPMKKSEKKKEMLNQREVRAMKRASQRDVKKKAVLYLLIATGMRVSELVRLNRDDIDFAKGEVTVFAQKTGKWRTVFINKKTVRAIRAYLATRIDADPALFLNRANRRMQPASAQTVVKSLAKKTKIKKKVSVHIFRKTLASTLINNGMEPARVSYILGHASYKTTEKYYVIANISSIKAEYLKAFNL